MYLLRSNLSHNIEHKQLQEQQKLSYDKTRETLKDLLLKGTKCMQETMFVKGTMVARRNSKQLAIGHHFGKDKLINGLVIYHQFNQICNRMVEYNSVDIMQ